MAKQKMKEEHSIFVNLEVLVGKQGDYFVSYCPALELSSYGDNEEDAKTGFDEALHIFITDLASKGTLEKTLLKLGWSLKQAPKAAYIPPKANKGLLSKFVRPEVFTERVAIPY